MYTADTFPEIIISGQLTPQKPSRQWCIIHYTATHVLRILAVKYSTMFFKYQRLLITWNINLQRIAVLPSYTRACMVITYYIVRYLYFP